MWIKTSENEIVIYPFADRTTSPERLQVLGKITICAIPDNKGGSHQTVGDVCFDVPFGAADRRAWDKVQGSMEIALKLGDLIRGGASAEDAVRQANFRPEMDSLAQLYRAVKVANAAGQLLRYGYDGPFLGDETEEFRAATVAYISHQHPSDDGNNHQ